ncbi:mucin-2-like isoform X1 [Uranotaenia lowii]|uniref:mucin-2-like isoform X1 n=1 Tax=Uranotaenia lowii TaxID=190385 RepID=UPI00247AA963|nr:mucin-2-like isoform X1 [Uranotaenia lowii]XP_055595063.1 mucin-2-like isoform X1 [Uranotaenia lowii]XP_055595064.1 mucin-2-like isoform X1 [Uranotaenia lowii]XP_055595065.1 mucin-2-like isoform X1 [Uranotaenia lowii]
MRRLVDLGFVIRIWLALLCVESSQSENAEPRALDISVPWRPLSYHVPQQQLISVASFDTTSKDELVQIAQHNANILKHFNQPITQYQQNPGSNNPQQGQHPAQGLAGGPQAPQTLQTQQPSIPPGQLQPKLSPPPPGVFGGHTPIPKYMTTPLLLTNVSPAGAMQTTARHSMKSPYGSKSDQITTLNIVHTPPTQKVPGPGVSSHLAPVGVKAPKFNSQLREPSATLNAPPPPSRQKSTLKPHPVMNKLQSHMAVAYHQKQPVTATSNRLEHYVSPNNLYGTYIQFGHVSSPLQSAKTKFISQLASHPSFDSQLKGLLHAGAGGSYQQTMAHIKNLQKLNYMQQQNKLQPYFNHIPIEADFPKKSILPVEKDVSKIPVTPTTPLFPHIPPSVLTPFFQQVQQQQQNKYSFSLKTQHPAPPAASQVPTSQSLKEKPFKPPQSQFQFESHQSHSTALQPFKDHHAADSFGFNAYHKHQQLPIEHKPHEAIKFKENKHVFNEIHDEYSKNLVPPPMSTEQAFLPTIVNHVESSKDPIEILNKYNINPHSPLQDTNRFNYESYARPSSSPFHPTSTPSTTSAATPSSTQRPPSTTPRQPFYSHTITFGGEHNNFNTPVLVTPINEDWIGRDKFITTEKPNVFKHLFRPIESEYKQHKLMHPSYTGLPPNKRVQSTTPLAPVESSTEEPLITHSFFTIEDAISDPTLIPPNNRNKYKYSTEAEGNRVDEPQPEIVTIGPAFDSSQESGTTTVYPMFKSKGRRRRPKPHSSSTTEQSAEVDSNESPLERPNRNRFRYRPRPTLEAENEIKTTEIPTTPFLTEDSSLKKLRKKPSNFDKTRVTSSNIRNEISDQEREHSDVFDFSPVTQDAIVTTTTVNSILGALFNETIGSNNGLRSRFRPISGERNNVTPDTKNTRTKSKFSEELQDLFKSTEVTRDPETTRPNFKMPSLKPSLRLPATTYTSSTSSTFASSTSEETSAEVNRTRPELNRPRFSIKEFRNKLNRTTTSTTPSSSFSTDTESTTPSASTKLRFPTRNRFLLNTRLTPLNKTTDSNEILFSNSSSSGNSLPSTTEKSLVSAVGNDSTTTRTSFRPTGTRSYNRFTVKKATTENPSVGSPVTSSTNGNSLSTFRTASRGRIRLQDTTTQSSLNRTANPSTLNSSTLANRRPPKISLRQRIQNYNRKKESDSGSQKDVDPASNSLLNSSDELKTFDDLEPHNSRYDEGTIEGAGPGSSGTSTTTEGYRQPETAIMKISPKDSPSATFNGYGETDWDLNSASSDYSKRVVELTLSASKDKGFKSVNKGLLSRRVPGYFTLATEDPILPIEAFFPQVKKVNA